MNVIKRNGTEVPFEAEKIRIAIGKANKEGLELERISESKIDEIVNEIVSECEKETHAIGIEDIQDKVEMKLMKAGAFKIAKLYITYRYQHSLLRQKNTIDESIESLLNDNNEEIKQENSNKNPTIVSVQRDYMAGEVSKDYTRRFLLPPDILKAHDEGIIHFHDMDYFACKLANCSLINLEDMLQNGTVISGTGIDKPHSFSTACNIATQIIAQVASSQFGGQTISLSHLAPFVDVSRKKIIKDLEESSKFTGIKYEKSQFDYMVNKQLKKEIEKGVQIIQYQVITLMTTNGQAPFITIFMYLNEVEDDQTKKDLAMIIEEVLKQRYLGVKNETGAWISPAFPKLIYVLDENNIHPDSEYYYLTQMAAKCTARRLVPDYISAKVMKELKEGNVFPNMSCVLGDEVVTYKKDERLYVEGFERMWNRLSLFNSKAVHQFNDLNNPNLIVDLKDQNIKVWDNKINKFVKVNNIIRNVSHELLDIKFSNGRCIQCTPDHPFTLNNGIDKKAKDLSIGDPISFDFNQYSEETENIDPDLAWCLGVMICDGCYDGHIVISINSVGEDEIEEKYISTMKQILNCNPVTVLQEKGERTSYKDIIINYSELNRHSRLKFYHFLEKFMGGKQKVYRSINPLIFRAKKESKLAFLAGLIDADGHINANSNMVQIGSINKEFSIQQCLLAQSLGMKARIYKNFYYGRNKSEKIRYRVEFCPTPELVSYIACKKKRDNFNPNKLDARKIEDFGQVTEINPVIEDSVVNGVYTYDISTESEHFTVSGIYSHNCRSFLSPYVDPETGKQKYYGRFNQGVVTINLPDVACSSNGDMEKFWEIFDERLELCHRALRIRHERLLGTSSDVAPIIWQYGGYNRLKKGEKIDKLLFDNYSSISLGYAGLYECVMRMTGESHTNKNKGFPFAIDVMKKMNEKITKWKKEENIGYALYGTPIESTTYKFAKCLKKRFGEIPEVTDHNYITNSFHVVVRENIDAFSKLSLEAEFQKYSLGGCISYVEVPNMQNNIPAIMSLLTHIYNTIMYAELNTKSDFCQKCGFDGEIQIKEDENKKLYWCCPKCGNTDQKTMNVARRTCGYIGTQYWNQGRTQEIKERVLHL